MTTAKKLICGHLFHVHCLRSWLERQHTCPTCRALVVPSENGTAAVGGQRGVHVEAHQGRSFQTFKSSFNSYVICMHDYSMLYQMLPPVEAGAGTNNTSSSSVASVGGNDVLSQHEARVEAAAAAASIYEKSYVYPCANTFTWYVRCVSYSTQCWH